MMWGRFSMGLVMPQPKRFGYFHSAPDWKTPVPILRGADE